MDFLRSLQIGDKLTIDNETLTVFRAAKGFQGRVELSRPFYVWNVRIRCEDGVLQIWWSPQSRYQPLQISRICLE